MAAHDAVTYRKYSEVAPPYNAPMTRMPPARKMGARAAGREALFVRLRDSGAYQFESRISAAQYDPAYRLVERHVPVPARALDWGCGEGHFSAFLLAAGLETVAFTLQNDCILAEELARDYGECFQLVRSSGSIRSLPFPDENFDLVTSIGVLEHVRETGGDEADSLREIARILRPGGIFLCFHLPNRWSWIEAITRHLENKQSHLYKFSRRELRAMVTANGLELLESRRYGILPRLMTRGLPRALRESAALTAAYDAMDRTLSCLVPWFCQNHYAVARRRARG